VKDKWGYIDQKGKKVILPRFDVAQPFAANGLAAVMAEDKWGYIRVPLARQGDDDRAGDAPPGPARK
jgi:hypothetical protein